MGLAGPHNRTKIGVDPRNTNWSKNTDRFGHRILTTLGWQPGNTLGDTSSLYHQSGHITAASTTGVKIALKDDNLGIGCNKRQREDECVGLDVFQNLLGRLNGKCEYELDKEAETRDRMRRETVVGERYGMRFVRGETYVSSDIEALVKRTKGEKREEEERGIVVKDGKKKKERKGRKGRKEIKNEGMKNSGEIATIPATPSDVDSSVSAKKGKKQKKIKRGKSSLKSASITPASSDDSDSRSKKRKRTDEEDIGESTKGKKGKISKKSKSGETHEQRKERRAGERKARKAEKGKSKKKRNLSSDSSDLSEDESTAAASGTATPSSNAALVGRQAVRYRYIAAKRSAVMDAKALNEIFMVKG